MSLAELHVDVRLITAGVRDADQILAKFDGDLDAEHALVILADLRAARSELSLVHEALEDLIGEALERYETVIEGVGTVRRHKRTRRRNWDSEALLRAVLDARRFDKTTGELVEETVLDRVRHVYGLAGYSARVGALKARNLDPDQYCETETRGFTIEVRK